jgi:hypothetical protein
VSEFDAYIAEAVDVIVGVFGDPVTYSRAAVDPLIGQFRQAGIDETTQMPTQASLLLKISDLATAPQRLDLLTIDGVEYRVEDVRYLNTASVRLILHETA